MAQHFNNDEDLIADMGEFDLQYEFELDFPQEVNNFEVDTDIELIVKENDTSASEYRNGKDIQGIPWENLQFSRKQYRELRLKLYMNYENLPESQDGLEEGCKQVKRESTFYDFEYNTRVVKSTIMHFQLRNLLWATTQHDIYLMQNCSVMHWSSLLRRAKEVLNVAGKIVPNQKYQGSLPQPLSRVKISTMVVKGNLMVAGGIQGELICKYLDQPGVVFSMKLTDDEDEITNAVDIYWSSNGSMRVMAANNDGCVRVFDTEKYALLNCFSFPWPVNSTSMSPDGKLLAVLGDSTNCLIADSQSGEVISTLEGHSDYSFASAWHPDGQILATGNQDKTCRLWDVRKLSESLAVLKGRIGAIRCIKFSSDGQFMAMAESADFVHIYDVKADYCSAQEIDLFGEIAGISFSPNTESFFVSIEGRNYGSLLELSRRRQLHYLNCLN